MNLKDSSKEALRKKFRELRKKFPKSEHEILSARICQRVWQEWIEPTAQRAVVGLYYPIDAEVDIRILAEKLAHEGVSMALPVQDSAPVLYRSFKSFDQLDHEFHLQRLPAPPKNWPEAEPSILIVPGIAFSRAGYRLGYGKGYFDQTIHALREKKGGPLVCIGVCFDFQLVATLPHEAHDIPMDAIITEMESLHLAPRS